MVAHGRKYDSLSADDPTVGVECPACHVAFAVGDATTMVLLGPGSDPDAQRRARDGLASMTVA